MDKTWEWKINEHIDLIEMTVALPALNAEKIIWLALESLKNQKDIKFKWELICFEEYGKSRECIKSYIGKLPNCSRILHYNVDPNLEGRKKGELKGKYLLIDKWINIAKITSKNSKIFVLHAADCYSPPKRLYIHYQHFKKPKCYFSTQRRGIFYNIISKKIMLYDGNYIDGINKRNNKFKNDNFVETHLNMALLTSDMKKIPYVYVNKGIDGYIKDSISKLHNLNYYKRKHIYVDEFVDNDNWKYSLDTDGYNNISLRRSSYYDAIEKTTNPIGPWANIQIQLKLNNLFDYKGMESYIPKYILEKLNIM